MKVFFVFILIAAYSASYAQGTARLAPEEKKAQKTMDSKTFTKFDLTELQKVKILSILISQNKSLDSLADTSNEGNLAFLQSQIYSANDLKILDIMAEEQQKAYLKYVELRNFRALSASSAAPVKPKVTKVTEIRGERVSQPIP